MHPFSFVFLNVKTFNEKCEGVFKIRLRIFLFRLHDFKNRLHGLFQTLKQSLQNYCGRNFTVGSFRNNE